MQAPDVRLSLYLFEGCPWCERVRVAVKDLGLEVEERNIRRDATHAEALHKAMGRGTVPVLRIDDGDESRWMPESADIVRFLYDTYGHGRTPALLASGFIQRFVGVLAVVFIVGGFFVPGSWGKVLFVLAAIAIVTRNSVPFLGRLRGR